MLKVDLLRQPKLFFQIFDQLLEALCGDGVVSQGSRPLGLLQPPLKFFSVALFDHSDALSSQFKTEERRNSSHLSVRYFGLRLNVPIFRSSCQSSTSRSITSVLILKSAS